jgi:hypothetical protein
MLWTFVATQTKPPPEHPPPDELPPYHLPFASGHVTIESMHKRVMMGRMGVMTAVYLMTTITQWAMMVGTSVMIASSVLRMIIWSTIGRIAYSKLDPSALTFRSSTTIIRPTGLTR